MSLTEVPQFFFGVNASVELLAALAAFSSYTSMYAFRKAFAAGIFDHAVYLHIDYKVWLQFLPFENTHQTRIIKK